MGGRLDATNVIDQPRLSIITPISIDHEQFPGNTLTKLRGKRRGSSNAVARDRGPTTRRGDGRDRGDRRAPSRPNHRQGQHWHIDTERDGLMFQDETGVVQLPRPIAGDHQIENAGTAVGAAPLWVQR